MLGSYPYKPLKKKRYPSIPHFSDTGDWVSSVITAPNGHQSVVRELALAYGQEQFLVILSISTE
jgi:hypothetical protein